MELIWNLDWKSFSKNSEYEEHRVPVYLSLRKRARFAIKVHGNSESLGLSRARGDIRLYRWDRFLPRNPRAARNPRVNNIDQAISRYLEKRNGWRRERKRYLLDNVVTTGSSSGNSILAILLASTCGLPVVYETGDTAAKFRFVFLDFGSIIKSNYRVYDAAYFSCLDQCVTLEQGMSGR